MTDISKWVNFA